MDKKEKKIIPLNQRILLILFPVMILAFAIVFLVTFQKTRRILLEQLFSTANDKLQIVAYHISSEMGRTVGIVDNVKKSVERSCDTEEEISRYMFSVADAYPDTIPSGIYCGLESGTYIDKMWTPGSDWVMKERPWYVEGLLADQVSMGEMYMDADTGEYIVSVYANVQKNGNAFGVISADVQISNIIQMVESVEMAEGTGMYGFDSYSGLVFADKTLDGAEKNVFEAEGDIDRQIVAMYQNGELDQMKDLGDQYAMLHKVEGTNMVLVYHMTEDAIRNDMASVRNSSFSTSVIGIVILGIAVYALVSIALHPMKKLRKMVLRMSELDLTEVSNIRTRDEMGEMSDALNKMAANLKLMIGEMRDRIKSIDANADANALTASDLADASQDQFGNVEELAGMMMEMNGSIELIAEGATNLAGTVADTANIIEEASVVLSQTKTEISRGNEAMDHMTGTMQSITDLSNDLTKAVGDVQEGVQGISQMVTVINDIASQTSLLSLNASIEAARAGEAGRGFAVVAEEIRKLSESVAESVSSIHTTTGNMQNLVAVVLEKTQQSREAVGLGGDAVRETERVFTQISENIDQMNTVMQSVDHAFHDVERVADDMAASTEEQSASTNMVLATSDSIKSVSKHFSEDAASMSESGKVLKELTDDLDEKIDRFRV